MDIERLSFIVSLLFGPVDFFVCALALVRKVWRILPCFAIYAVALVLVVTARWIVLFHWGLRSGAYALTFWMTEPLMIVARAAVLADICRAVLRPYWGIWRLAKPLLMVTATLLLMFAAVRMNQSARMESYILFVERELEFAIVLSLLAILVLSRYYGVSLERPLAGIALGIGFYASYLIMADTIKLYYPQIPQGEFSIAHSIAYTMAEAIWIRTLWAPLPVPVQARLSTAESYEQNSLAVTEGMKEVNERLARLFKK